MNSAIIHSQLSRSEQFLSLSNEAALLLLLSWPHCDDYGRIKASPTHWVLNVCPGRFELAKVKELLEEILDSTDDKGESMYTRYEISGQEYLFVTNWFRFQGIRHNYNAKAVCPHPMVGIVEPPALGSQLTATFGDQMQDYNRLFEEVKAFITSRNPRENKANPRGNADNPRETTDDSRSDARKDDESARNEPNFRGSRARVAPAPSPASAYSPSPAPVAGEGANAPRASRRRGPPRRNSGDFASHSGGNGSGKPDLPLRTMPSEQDEIVRKRQLIRQQAASSGVLEAPPPPIDEQAFASLELQVRTEKAVQIRSERYAAEAAKEGLDLPGWRVKRARELGIDQGEMLRRDLAEIQEELGGER